MIDKFTKVHAKIHLSFKTEIEYLKNNSGLVDPIVDLRWGSWNDGFERLRWGCHDYDIIKDTKEFIFAKIEDERFCLLQGWIVEMLRGKELFYIDKQLKLKSWEGLKKPELRMC